MSEPKFCHNGKIKLLLLWMNQLWSAIHELNIFALTAWLYPKFGPNGRNGFKELFGVYNLSHIHHWNTYILCNIQSPSSDWYVLFGVFSIWSIWSIYMGGRAINKAINKQHASCLPPRLSTLEKGNSPGNGRHGCLGTWVRSG